jgi:CRP-like cAMP-binding protein
MTDSKLNNFDPAEFLAKAGLGRTIIHVQAKETFFSQGDAADSVFYLQKGRAKVTVVSNAGKEAHLRFSRRAILLGRNRLLQSPDCAWRPRPPSPAALR